MKKRKVILLVFIILAIITIPVGIYASRTLFMHHESDEEIELANQKERERLLEEKKKFAEGSSNNVVSTQTYTVDNGVERDEEIDREIEELNKKEEQQVAIMRRYYPKEIDEAIEKAKEEPITGITNLSTDSLRDVDRMVYDIVLKILEKENLNETDRNLLKDYLKTGKDQIAKDSNLQARAEKILNN